MDVPGTTWTSSISSRPHSLPSNMAIISSESWDLYVYTYVYYVFVYCVYGIWTPRYVSGWVVYNMWNIQEKYTRGILQNAYSSHDITSRLELSYNLVLFIVYCLLFIVIHTVELHYEEVHDDYDYMHTRIFLYVYIYTVICVSPVSGIGHHGVCCNHDTTILRNSR